jgi:abhydrolase domain-containing protein 11
MMNLSKTIFKPPKITNKYSPPLIILHGLFGSKQNWRSLGKSLAQKLESEVIAVDLR